MRSLLFIMLFLPWLPVQSEPVSWQLVYSSNFNSELKPCGCSKEGNLGGILRRASRLEQLRKDHPRLVVVSAGDILGQADEQGQIKAGFMLQGVAQLELDGILPGEQDLQYPLTVLKRRALPWVLTNGDEVLKFDRYRERQIGTHRLLIVGLLDPALLPPPQAEHLSDMHTALHGILQSRRITREDIVIVLAHSNETTAVSFYQHPLVDVVVRGHLAQPVSAIPNRLPALLAAGHRGQRLGIADFKTDTVTRLVSNRIETLPGTIPDHPSMTRLYERYDAEITRWYRAKVAASKTMQIQTPYAGVTLCRACHAGAFDKWSRTRHARALDSLTKVKKDNDPECLQCHTTGMGTPGGFVAREVTPGLVNIQCEACHGPARAHAEYPLRHRLPNAFSNCARCHTKENSPAFERDRYWASIAHTKSPGVPRHRQSISRVAGEYEVLDIKQAIVTQGPIVVTEYFNFYCSRCYILDSAWQRLRDQLKKPVVHEEIPITFGAEQAPWAALAYLAARRAGKGSEFKSAIFRARFEQNADIDNPDTLVQLARSLDLEAEVRRALVQGPTPEQRQYQEGMKQRDLRNVTHTPTVIINNNLKVTPANTGDNTNLMVDNLLEIMSDLQCRQQAACD